MNKFAVAALGLALAAKPCASADLLAMPDDGMAILFIDGEIKPGDDVRLRKLVDKWGKDQFRYVEIMSQGGDVNTALKMSDILNYDMVVDVHVKHQCMSACAFIALAARRRLFVAGGEIMVHEPWTGDGTPAPRTARIVIDWLRNCGVTESILTKIMHTPPNSMVTISRKELEAMGATVQ
jgi:hypothetical protein